MSYQRIDRISEQVRREVDRIIRDRLSDPRIRGTFSVTRAEVCLLYTSMDDATVTITGETEQPLVFQRREVAVVKPVIELDEDDFADVEFDALNDEE